MFSLTNNRTIATALGYSFLTKRIHRQSILSCCGKSCFKIFCSTLWTHTIKVVLTLEAAIKTPN